MSARLLAFFFFNDTATTEIYTLSLHDALPISELILITSQEIDELGEGDNVAQARLQIDSVLSHLRRGARGLADQERKSTRLNSKPSPNPYARLFLQKKKTNANSGIVATLPCVA